MSLFIDMHAHFEWFEDIDKVVDNAKKAGVKVILASGISKNTNETALQLSKKYDIIKPSLGLYPIGALEKETGLNVNVDDEIEFIRENKNNISAIGEAGLDFKKAPDKDRQKEAFEKIILLADEIKKPLIVHSRKAEPEVIKMLEKSNLKKIILHCFCGKRKLVERAKDNGWYFTIPTNVVRLQQFQDMIKIVNLSHLFCETDSPFLSPFPDKKNEPAFVIESYKKIAEIKGLELQEVEKAIWMNWQGIF